MEAESYAIRPATNASNVTILIDSSHDVALMVVNACIGSFGIIGNGLVCFVLTFRRRKFRSNTGLLIFNQSLIDLISSAVFSALRFGPDSYALPSQFWSDMICKIWASEYVLWSLFYVSTSNLVIISLDRYFAMCHPIRHRSTFTKRRIQLAMGAAWAIGFLYEAYWIFLNHHVTDVGCIPIWPSQKAQMAVGIMLFIVEYLLPIFIMGFCYINIICVIHRRRHSTLSTQVENFLRARKNVSITLCLVAISFFVCWTPTEVSYLMFNCGWGYDFNSIFHDVVVVLVQLNLCVNPWIYSFKYEMFQRQLKDIFCGCCCDTSSNSLCDGMNSAANTTPAHHSSNPSTRSCRTNRNMSPGQVTVNKMIRTENGHTWQLKDILCGCCCDTRSNSLCDGMTSAANTTPAHHSANPATRSCRTNRTTTSQGQVTVNKTIRTENDRTWQLKDILCGCCCDTSSNSLCDGMTSTNTRPAHHPSNHATRSCRTNRTTSPGQVTVNKTIRTENGRTETWIVLC